MDQKQIEKLMSAMEHSRIKRIVIKRQDFEIEIEKECAQTPMSSFIPPTHYAPPLPTTSGENAKSITEPLTSNETKEKVLALFVTSPMVGTFYASPTPDDPPFVKVGDVVSENTVVCIIEAMKVMNEVKAGVKGSVSEILLKNGEPVEFGTHIFRVNPA